MSGNSLGTKEGGATGLEMRMRKVSRVVSLAGMALMFSGFMVMGVEDAGASLALPGAAVLPLSRLVQLQGASLGLILASAGIILFCLLPALRVMLACWLYLRLRDFSSTLIALLVFLELLASIRMSL